MESLRPAITCAWLRHDVTEVVARAIDSREAMFYNSNIILAYQYPV